MTDATTCRSCAARCGRTATAGRPLCHDCERDMMGDLLAIGRNATPLLMVATRQVSASAGGGHGAHPEAVSPLRDDAWDLYCDIEQTLRLAGAITGYRRAHAQHASLAELAGAILRHPGPLLASPDVRWWKRDLHDARHRMELILDPPAPRILFGRCPRCGGTVWGGQDDDTGRCDECRMLMGRRDVTDQLLALLAESDVTGTPRELSDECARAGIRLPAATIRSWVARGHLTQDEAGEISLARLVPLLARRATWGRKD